MAIVTLIAGLLALATTGRALTCYQCQNIVGTMPEGLTQAQQATLDAVQNGLQFVSNAKCADEPGEVISGTVTCSEDTIDENHENRCVSGRIETQYTEEEGAYINMTIDFRTCFLVGVDSDTCIATGDVESRIEARIVQMVSIVSEQGAEGIVAKLSDYKGQMCSCKTDSCDCDDCDSGTNGTTESTGTTQSSGDSSEEDTSAGAAVYPGALISVVLLMGSAFLK